MKGLYLISFMLLGGLFCHAQLVYSDSLIMAAENGDADAQCRLGNCYMYAEDDEQRELYSNRQDAVYWWKQAAEQDQPEALYNLAFNEDLYIDYLKSARYLRRAVEGGFNPAFHELALLYSQGMGVVYSPLKAIQYFTISAQNGNPKSAYELGRILLNEDYTDQIDPLIYYCFFIAHQMSKRAMLYSEGELHPVSQYWQNVFIKDLNQAAQKLDPEEIKRLQALAHDWLAEYMLDEEDL